MNVCYKRLAYYEAKLIVLMHQLLGYPKYMYSWWITRLKLIKSNKI